MHDVTHQPGNKLILQIPGTAGFKRITKPETSFFKKFNRYQRRFVESLPVFFHGTFVLLEYRDVTVREQAPPVVVPVFVKL
jgi:hypothetical protein